MAIFVCSVNITIGIAYEAMGADLT